MKEQEKKPSEHECTGGDQLVQAGPMQHGMIPVVRHREDHRIERAIIIPGGLPDGTPMSPGSEMVQVGPPDSNGIRKVETSFKCPGHAPEKPMSQTGPAQVATNEYRQGWDRIFGCRSEKPSANMCACCLVKEVAYPGARFCGAGCSARWEAGDRPEKKPHAHVCTDGLATDEGCGACDAIVNAKGGVA